MNALQTLSRTSLRSFLLVCAITWCSQSTSQATDYFLTLGGGYSRSGNQSSLEANVVFFQQILAEQHKGERQHTIFFADGNDPGADLQVLAEKPEKSDTPATDLLAGLHRRRGEGQRVTYRNHRVPDVAGSLDPKLIQAQLEKLAKSVEKGDRLLIFVTAHGSPGKQEEPLNTSLDCWKNRKILAREFAGWLDKLPTDLPVVLVMAQCYCGGFGHTIFTELDEKQGLTPHVRAGFFAQQHDLPAAGCRPDIEHDEEFSSYFWGAIAGRSRNGVPITGCDLDGDGAVSFAEAYAHAVIAGETIDIPLRTSEVLLRTYSRLTPEKAEVAASETDTKSETAEGPAPKAKEETNLVTLSGKLEDLLAKCRPVSARIVTQLAKTLDISLHDDVSAVMKSYEEQRRASRQSGRGRNRPGSARRDLLKEVTDKWPELGDARKWADSPLLNADNQEQLLAELKALPSWKTYDARRQQLSEADQTSDERELRTAKFRRLINTLETIVLDKNLPLLATPQVVEKYQQLLALEESTLNSSAGRK